MAQRIVEVDLANERVILATMIHDPELRRRISHDLRASEFGDTKHQILFRALSLLARRGLVYSEDTLLELVKGEDHGGYEYLRALSDEYEPNRNVEFHMERLRVDAVKLALLQTDLPGVSSACEDPTTPPERLVQLLRAAVGRVERAGRRFETKGDDLVDGYYATLRARKIDGGAVDGFGFPILDSVLVRGFSPGAVSILAARPGVGKTTVVASVIRHRVLSEKGTYLCGWEMTRDDYLDMMVAAETSIPASVLSNAVRSLSDEQKLAVQDAVERYRDARLLVVQENPFTKLERPTDRWADLNQRNLDFFEGTVAEASKTKSLIVVDVVGSLFSDRRPDKISEALVRISEMAKAYSVHFLLLHHTNREGALGRPTLESLKGAGAFEEVADNVFGLDRPIQRASVARRKKMTDHLDVHILKQRKGPAPLCVRYRFDGPRFCLTDEVEVDLSMLESDGDEDSA
jgi:replicative DNA helicase